MAEQPRPRPSRVDPDQRTSQLPEHARRARAQIEGDAILAPGHTYTSITDKISSLVLTRRTPRGWFIGFLISFALFGLLMLAMTWLLVKGTGVWGNNVPVGWAFDIINFVWWIGIGHAGTLISAILLLLRQPWRTSINRFAEAMTLFAVSAAFIYPALHTGRPWFDYWMLPYPTNFGVWPQFRSPLIWDVFAVTTYATVSALFWFVGLIPDLATLRDRAKNRGAQVIYGLLAMGWRGSARHWIRYERAYFLLAALATPLVISVHTVVSFDFATSVIPGWHATIFPPYFVAGAIFAGFAMVLTLAIPLRVAYGLEDFITLRHLENMAKVMLLSGLIVAYGYTIEHFMAWYSGNPYEIYQFFEARWRGPYFVLFWGMILCNVIAPQAIWSKTVRTSPLALWIIAMFVNVGMWLERFNIIVTSLARDFIPAAWGNYSPTVWDYSLYIGSIGLFLTLIFLFVRFLPIISTFEMRELLSRSGEETSRGGVRPAPEPGTAD